MSSDDPFSNEGDRNRTVIRPTPGGRRGGLPPQVPSPQAPAAPPGMAPVDPLSQGIGPQSPAVPGSAQPFVPPAAATIMGSGLNPVIDAAMALLVLASQLRNTTTHPDVAGLRQHVVQQIKAFEQTARAKGATPETTLAARYTLCTFLDETVLSTPWGSESVWSSQSLLSLFHNETWGGEKFFLILDRMIQEPAANIDMLELMYVCLALGFEGKFGVLEHGHSKLAEVQDNVFRTIRMQRGDFERELSPHWRGVQDRRSALVRYVPLWVVGALAGVMLLATYAGFRFVLENTSSPIYEAVDRLGRDTGVEGKEL